MSEKDEVEDLGKTKTKQETEIGNRKGKLSDIGRCMFMPAVPKFEVYKDHADKFRWRLKASNDQEIASGQGYESKEGCKDGIKSVKANASKAKIVDMTE